ncbi:MAG: TetR/AcrR family transcriptional regulator [Zoogloeaceae bacterium]|jgi:AcrR family transcriptional regulator|nr:TetR/AcrR family transcriptional regulator [Zoogloeaceae bacterium]
MPHTESRRKPRSARARKLKPDERRAALLQAAKEISAEAGGVAPSLDAIIQRAGGSRRSIYTEFGGKAGLMNALVDEIASEILASFVDDLGQTRNLRTILTCLARNIVTVLTSERGIRLSRIVLLDSLTSPERARTFFSRGPGEGVKRLAEILEAARLRGEIEIQNAPSAAACFVGMARGNLHLERVLQLRPPLNAEEIEAHVNSVVDIFLRGIAWSATEN